MVQSGFDSRMGWQAVLRENREMQNCECADGETGSGRTQRMLKMAVSAIGTPDEELTEQEGERA